MFPVPNCRKLGKTVLCISTKNLYNLKEIPCFSLYFPCLAGKISRQFLPSLKTSKSTTFSRFTAALSSPKNYHFLPLHYRFGKTKKLALFAASLPLRPKREIGHFQPLFYRFGKKKVPFSACFQPVLNQHSARGTKSTVF